MMFDITFMVYDENGNGVGIEVSNTADDISIPLEMARNMSIALGRLIELMEE